MRRTAAMVTALFLSTSSATGVVAQDPPTEPVIIFTCATITGDAPGGTWDAVSLQAAVAAGEATFDSFSLPEECRSSEEPSQAGSGNSGTSPSGTDAEAPEPPRPIEVREVAMSDLSGTVSYLVIIENTNPADWAVSMPVRVDVLNKKGKRVGFAYDRLLLLPGQTGALSGLIAGAKGATKLDVIPAGHVTNYIPASAEGSDVRINDVETKVADFLGTTTGTIAGVPADAQAVILTSVYRNKKGKVLATSSAYLPGPPEDGTMFEINSFIDGKVAETETYYEVIR